MRIALMKWRWGKGQAVGVRAIHHTRARRVDHRQHDVITIRRVVQLYACAACGFTYVPGRSVLRRSAVAQGIAELIGQADGGNGEASERLFATLYDELHRLAERQL